METKDKTTTKRTFVLKIASIDIGLMLLAGYLALTMNIQFGLVLLILGILVGGIGAFMNSSTPVVSNHPRDRQFNYLNRLEQYRLSGLADSADQPAASLGVENVMAFAGFIAIVLSIPFLLTGLVSR